jgi:hypothetical protein
MNSTQSIRRGVEWLGSQRNRHHLRSAPKRPGTPVPGDRTDNVRHAGISFRMSRCGRGIPSPLNGEKVAEGRMRGGQTHRSGFHPAGFQHRSALSPLTPALSPSRTEGDCNVSRDHIACAIRCSKTVHSRGIVFSFGSDCLINGAFPNITPRLPFTCQR